MMSTKMSKVRDIIEDLSRRKNDVACDGKGGLRLYLAELGFDDAPGKTIGHRIFTNQRLSDESEFISFSIDCGHKPRRSMKFPYVVKTINILRKYQAVLESFEEDDYDA